MIPLQGWSETCLFWITASPVSEDPRYSAGPDDGVKVRGEMSDWVRHCTLSGGLLMYNITVMCYVLLSGGDWSPVSTSLLRFMTIARRELSLDNPQYRSRLGQSLSQVLIWFCQSPVPIDLQPWRRQIGHWWQDFRDLRTVPIPHSLTSKARNIPRPLHHDLIRKIFL